MSAAVVASINLFNGVNVGRRDTEFSHNRLSCKGAKEVPNTLVYNEGFSTNIPLQKLAGQPLKAK